MSQKVNFQVKRATINTYRNAEGITRKQLVVICMLTAATAPFYESNKSAEGEATFVFKGRSLQSLLSGLNCPTPELAVNYFNGGGAVLSYDAVTGVKDAEYTDRKGEVRKYSKSGINLLNGAASFGKVATAKLAALHEQVAIAKLSADSSEDMYADDTVRNTGSTSNTTEEDEEDETDVISGNAPATKAAKSTTKVTKPVVKDEADA